MIFILVFITSLLVAALYTYFRVREINRQIRPDGSFAEVGGARLHYHYYPADRRDPDAPVLVFLHGASGNAYDARLAFLNSLKNKHDLLFVDRPGLGFSTGQSGVHDLPEGQAKVLSLLLEELEIDNAIVVGHSLAGSVTAALALCAPERVRGLVFLAPVSHAWPGGVNWYYNVASWPALGAIFCWTLTLPIGQGQIEKALTNVFLPDGAPENYVRETKVLLLFRPASFRANARQIAYLKQAVIRQSKRYAEIMQPTLIVTGTHDTVVWPSIHCEGLLRDLPNAELLMLDLAGHMPQHTHTDTVVEAIEKLVKRVQDPNAGATESRAVERPLNKV
ncbi:alpha/beta hydrolase [Roseibium sp. HPY-6]|uniref:alpha/beta fold hydrolase n=1 Tax=Roseibium sp. HPY-6 TaxID=3229852 RepID=UPI00338F4184